jgi:hypothetical protein
MKKLAKVAIVLCLGMFIITTTGCGKDDPIVVNLTSIKYTPSTKTVAKGVAWTGSAAIKAPTTASVKYTIKSIKKGTTAFTNPTKGVKINATTGKLSLETGNTLEKAIYKVTVEGTDQKKKTIKKTTIFTITIN